MKNYKTQQSNYKRLSNYIGEKIGMIEVLSIYDSIKPYPKMLVKCQCGKELLRTEFFLLNSQRNGCLTCLSGRQNGYIEHLGKVRELKRLGIEPLMDGSTYGRATVISMDKNTRGIKYKARCRCGKIFTLKHEDANIENNGCLPCKKAHTRQIKLGLPVIV